MAPIIERINEVPSLILGEGPHWDDKTQSLFFVDVPGKTINKYTPSTGQHTKAQLDESASIIIPVNGKENQYVSGIGRNIVVITWDGKSEVVSKIESIAEVEKGTKNLLNDGKCDSKGKLWIGTYDTELLLGPKSEGQPSRDATGNLFLLDNKDISTQVTKVGCSNGLAWNKQEDKFYYIDTLKGTVYAFDFDLEKGILSNRIELFTTSKHGINGKPDGMTIDVDGNLWVAVFGGSCVLKIDPRKPETLVQKVQIPAKQVTSVAWGGKNLDELYVTTARFSLDGEDLPPPINGSLYRVTKLGTKGLPSENFVV